MRILRRANIALTAVFLLSVAPGFGEAPKLKAEDIVRRHLESIGAAQMRAAVQTRLVAGRVRMRMESGEAGPGASAMAAGTLALASSGNKFRIALPFQSSDYWGEQFVYDGTKADIGFSYIQKRSPIGDFVYRYDMILEEGLFGGVLSTAWALLEYIERKPKLEYAGMRKIGERQGHVLRYLRSKGQADLRIELIFDGQTFQHLRTSYNLSLPYDGQSPALSESQPTTIRGSGSIVPEGRGTVPRQEDTGRQGAQYRLEEYFDNFRATDGLMLPARWNIIFERASGNRTVQREWAVIIDQVTHNQPLGADAFVLEARYK